jgi:GTPase involved in cell partitioning and DNA repair
MADIPGLIEGAHDNLGMGHAFLRHIERTRVLLYVVDVNGFQLNTDSGHVSACEALRLLARELHMYQPGLHRRPGLLVVNKLDMKGSKQKYKQLQKDLVELVETLGLNIQVVVPTSMQSGAGMQDLKLALRALLGELNAPLSESKQRSKEKAQFTDSLFPKVREGF